MLKKWYISAFVLILTIFGIFSQKQTVLPNQELVLQFEESGVTSEEIQNTTTIVKQQLQALGVSNVKVKKTTNGKLKIVYYSDINIASIKKTFLQDCTLEVNFNTTNQNKNSSDLPFNQEDSISFNIDVYEIQNGNDSDWNLNGVNVPDFENKNDRFLSSYSKLFLNNPWVSKTNSVSELALKVSQHVIFTINNTSKSIPEVRAGPLF